MGKIGNKNERDKQSWKTKEERREPMTSRELNVKGGLLKQECDRERRRGEE